MMYYNIKPETRKCFEVGTTDSEIFKKIIYDIPTAVAAVKRVTVCITLVVATLATIITVIFIIAVLKAIKNHQVSRKCYILILTRSFGDLLTSFSFVLYSILRLSISNFTTTQLTVLQILLYIINAALWSEMISYNLLSGIKMYAVAKPLHYRNTFTIKRCLYLSSLSGIVFIAILLIDIIIYIIYGNQGAAYLFGKIQDATSTGIYCFTVIFFILTAIFVYRARKFPDGRSKKSKFPFSIFAIMFGTFIFFYSFLIASDIFFTFIESNLSFCYKLLSDVPVTAVQQSVFILILIRIFIDPIINCFIDKKVKASVKSLFPFTTCTVKDRKNANNKNRNIPSTEPMNASKDAICNI